MPVKRNSIGGKPLAAAKNNQHKHRRVSSSPPPKSSSKKKAGPVIFHLPDPSLEEIKNNTNAVATAASTPVRSGTQIHKTPKTASCNKCPGTLPPSKQTISTDLSMINFSSVAKLPNAGLDTSEYMKHLMADEAVINAGGGICNLDCKDDLTDKDKAVFRIGSRLVKKGKEYVAQPIYKNASEYTETMSDPSKCITVNQNDVEQKGSGSYTWSALDEKPMLPMNVATGGWTNGKKHSDEMLVNFVVYSYFEYFRRLGGKGAPGLADIPLEETHIVKIYDIMMGKEYYDSLGYSDYWDEKTGKLVRPSEDEDLHDLDWLFESKDGVFNLAQLIAIKKFCMKLSDGSPLERKKRQNLLEKVKWPNGTLKIPEDITMATGYVPKWDGKEKFDEVIFRKINDLEDVEEMYSHPGTLWCVATYIANIYKLWNFGKGVFVSAGKTGIGPYHLMYISDSTSSHKKDYMKFLTDNMRTNVQMKGIFPNSQPTVQKIGAINSATINNYLHKCVKDPKYGRSFPSGYVGCHRMCNATTAIEIPLEKAFTCKYVDSNFPNKCFIRKKDGNKVLMVPFMSAAFCINPHHLSLQTSERNEKHKECIGFSFEESFDEGCGMWRRKLGLFCKCVDMPGNPGKVHCLKIGVRGKPVYEFNQFSKEKYNQDRIEIKSRSDSNDK